MLHIAEAKAAEVLYVERCGLLWDDLQRYGEEVGRYEYGEMIKEEQRGARRDDRAYFR